jgi:hypothetical protein
MRYESPVVVFITLKTQRRLLKNISGLLTRKEAERAREENIHFICSPVFFVC